MKDINKRPMELPVTFGDYYLLEQIKKLNLRKIQISNQLRDAGVEVDAKKKLPGYPDSYIHGKVFSQLMSTMILYVTAEPMGNVLNPYGGLYEFDKAVGREEWANGKLFGKKVVVKNNTDSNEWNDVLLLLREYFIGTRLNHLRREIPHFMFTYGYTMCKPQYAEKLLQCGKEKVLFDGPVMPMTVLKNDVWFSNTWRKEAIDFNKFTDNLKHKCRTKSKDTFCRLNVWNAKRLEGHTFTKSGRFDGMQIYKPYTESFHTEGDPLHEDLPQSPHLFLEHVDAFANIEEWSKDLAEKPTGIMFMYSLYAQLVLALSMAQEKLSFLHLDLRPENILIVEKNKPVTVTYRVSGAIFTITTEYVPVIINYEMSRITHDHIPLFSETDENTGAFLPHVDFLALSKMFSGLLKKHHHKKFLPYENIFRGKRAPKISTPFHFIATLCLDPNFTKVVRIESSLEHPPTPIYWGLSPLFLAGQQLSGDAIDKWCDQLYSGLERCNTDTGSLILNRLQLKILSISSTYLQQIKKRDGKGVGVCGSHSIQQLPITDEQVKADEEGLDLASQIPLMSLANDSKNEHMKVLIPSSLSKKVRYPESWRETVLQYAYTLDEAIECGKVVTKQRDLFQAAEQLVHLIKYIHGLLFGSSELDLYLQKVVKDNQWDQAVTQLCDPLQDIFSNFLEKFRMNKFYLQQFCEGLQILLDSITMEALQENDRTSAVPETRNIITELKRMFQVVPDMFNPAFIEFIMSQPK